MEQLITNPVQGALATAMRIISVLRRSAAFTIPVIRSLLRAMFVVLRFVYRCLRRVITWAADWVLWANEPAKPKKVQKLPGLELEVTLVALLLVVGILNLFA